MPWLTIWTGRFFDRATISRLDLDVLVLVEERPTTGDLIWEGAG